MATSISSSLANDPQVLIKNDTLWLRREMLHEETWMLMEYCERGSLDELVRSGRLRLETGYPDLPVILACLLDIASGARAVPEPFLPCL
jgi:hypothetical protein